MESQRQLQWLLDSGLREANYWEKLAHGKVKCRLCPRNCLINPDRFGFCKTRYNDHGILKTAIWGKLLTPTIEPIENEAIYHYWPGSKILSLGNLGCNLNCDFCQNWESSNLLHLEEKYITYKSPGEIITLALHLGIETISFTYNDPVLWFEFVYETSRLAHKNGLKTLFKSAGFMSEQVARKLTEVIDIFSISLKSINPKTFKLISRGTLGPVLKAISIFHKSLSHLEISNLVVTGMNDNEEEARALSQWVKEELADNVPLHFVRFHPAYKYLHFQRTPIAFLEKARAIALEAGLKYVYIGNTYQENHGDIYCHNCKNLLIQRFGLYTSLVGVSNEGYCTACKKITDITIKPQNLKKEKAEGNVPKDHFLWQWKDRDIRNLHLQIYNSAHDKAMLKCEHLKKDGVIIDHEIMVIPRDTEIRFALGQSLEQEYAVRIRHSDTIRFYIAELEDRAHFPLKKIYYNANYYSLSSTLV